MRGRIRDLLFLLGVLAAFVPESFAQVPPAAAPGGVIPMAQTRIAEMPDGPVILIFGTIASLGQSYFVINDGTASVVVSAGSNWRIVTGLGEGERVKVIGHMDRFGTGMFIAASVTNTAGRTFPVQPYR